MRTSRLQQSTTLSTTVKEAHSVSTISTISQQTFNEDAFHQCMLTNSLIQCTSLTVSQVSLKDGASADKLEECDDNALKSRVQNQD